MSYSRRPAIKDCNLLFFDCETSGLSPVEHEIIEMGCILTDSTGRDILKEYSAKILPTKPVSKEAADLNGYTAEKWAGEAISLSTAMREFLVLAKDATLVAHNAPFDWSFLAAAMQQLAQKFTGYYHKADTVALAWPLLKAGRVPNVKLETLSAFFSIDNEAAHTAMSDVKTCREIYLKLMNLIKLD